MPQYEADATKAVCRHARLFDIPGQAVIATTLDGRIVYWNAAAGELYGWDAADVIGRDVVDVTPATAVRDEADRIMMALRAGRTWTGDFLVRGRDGSEFRALVRDVPVRDAFGELIGIVGISQRA